MDVRFEHRFHAGKKIQYTRTRQAVEHLVALFSGAYDTGVLQDRKVLGNRRYVRADHFGQLADAAFAAGKLVDDQKPRGMREGLQKPGAVLVGRRLPFL